MEKFKREKVKDLSERGKAQDLVSEEEKHKRKKYVVRQLKRTAEIEDKKYGLIVTECFL